MNPMHWNEGRADPRSVPASRAALIGLGEIVLHVLCGVALVLAGVGLALIFS